MMTRPPRDPSQPRIFPIATLVIPAVTVEKWLRASK